MYGRERERTEGGGGKKAKERKKDGKRARKREKHTEGSSDSYRGSRQFTSENYDPETINSSTMILTAN